MSDDQPVVEQVTAAVYTVPTDGPEADGTLAWDSTSIVVVHADAGGKHGLGWSYAAPAAAVVVDEVLASVVRGEPALDVGAINAAMSNAVRNIGRPGIAATAISAVDIALWDLKARLLGCSLTQVLGGGLPSVPVYGSGGFTTYDDERTGRQVQGWLDRGLTMMKIKIGEAWGSRSDRDLHRAALVGRLASGCELFVDANGGYTVGQAVRIGRSLDDLGVTWFEEPVSSDNLEGLRTVRESVPADVTAGEYGWDLPYFHRMIAAGAVDCLQIDATRCGGITEFLRAAATAAAANLDVSAHCAPHLHAAFVAAVPNLRHVEYFHDHVRIEEELVFAGARPAQGGHLITPQGPGHGYELRPSAEQWRVR